jgi:hypothetical protein
VVLDAGREDGAARGAAVPGSDGSPLGRVGSHSRSAMRPDASEWGGKKKPGSEWIRVSMG